MAHPKLPEITAQIGIIYETLAHVRASSLPHQLSEPLTQLVDVVSELNQVVCDLDGAGAGNAEDQQSDLKSLRAEILELKAEVRNLSMAKAKAASGKPKKQPPKKPVSNTIRKRGE